MPIERINSEFKDLSMTFQVNPLNYDLIAIKNENAIARSLRNLVLTIPGERFFNPILGSKISRSLFDILDDSTASTIKSQIENTIKNFEPRVVLIEVDVVADYDNQQFNVTITYQVVGIDAQPQELSFALQSTR